MDAQKKKQIASWRQKMISRQKTLILMRAAPTDCCIEMPIPTLYRPYTDPIQTYAARIRPYTDAIRPVYTRYRLVYGRYRVGIEPV